MLSSNVLNDAKLRKGVRRVSILACSALAFIPMLMCLGCPPITPCTVDADCTGDGVACTTATCTAGVCSNVDNCTAPNTCNAGTGVCTPPPCTTDADCDDTDACTGTETCVALACVAGTAVDCDDSDLCTTDTCDPTNGACTNTPVACVAPETCNATTGACGTPCTADADCDDALFCNGAETCDIVNNACQAGTNPCAANEICDENTTPNCTAGMGITFNLTTDVGGDAFNGTTGNDTFVATVGTLQPIDILVGGGGNNDVLNATIAGVSLSPAGAPFVTLIDIDVVNLTTLNTTTLNAINTAAIGIWNILTGSTGSFAITNVEADPVFTLGSGYAKMLSVMLANAGGGTDKIDVTLNGTAKGGGINTPDDAALETLNIDVAADSSITAATPAISFFGTLAALAGANNVTVTGSSTLTLDGGTAASYAADTFNFTGFTGNMGISPAPQGAGLTLNFVTLGFSNITRYTVNDITTQAHTLTFNNTDTNVTVDANSLPALLPMGNLTVTQGTGTSDSLTVNLGGPGTGMGALAAAASELITINSGGTTANVVANVTGPSGSVIVTQKVTLLGAQNLTLGNVTTNIVDATGLSGTLGMTALTTMTVNCGSGASTITGSANVDVQNGGAAADTLTTLAGNDTLNGGGGNDILDGGAGLDNVTGGAGLDTLRVSVIGLLGVDRALFTDFDDTATTGDVINMNSGVAVLTGTDNFATVASLQTHSGAGALAAAAATEVIIVTSATVVDLTSANSLNGTNLLTAIGGAFTGPLGANNRLLIAVADAAGNVGIYYGDSLISADFVAAELTLIAVLSGANVTLANMVFGNFTNAL